MSRALIQGSHPRLLTAMDLSCQDNDHSLVDSLIFIDSQDYRYKTINRCINCYHTDESHMDVVANIALVVESEKMGYFGLQQFHNHCRNYFSFH